MPSLPSVRVFALSLLAIVAGGSHALARCACDVEPASYDLPTATPESVGLDTSLLEQAVAYAEGLGGGLHSLLVVRNGKLAFERYFGGQDESSPHDQYSVTKTVSALLVGIARDRGKLPDLDAPLLSLLPAYAGIRNPGVERITLRHVLTMTSGFSWNEAVPWGDPENTMVAATHAPDPYRYLLQRPLAHEPGGTFHYNSVASGLLVAVLREAMGRPVEEFAQEALFGPLGIRPAHWERFRNGDPIGGWGLRIRPREMARLGYMMLAGGVWNGKRVVSKDWLDQMARPQAKAGNGVYGFQTWIDSDTIEGHTVDRFVAAGFGGQRIVMAPSLDLVVVMTAGYYSDNRQDTVPNGLMTRFILPAALRGAP